MMKRIAVLILGGGLLSACSISLEQVLLIPTSTPTFTPSPILTSTPTFTFTPTQPTPTFTSTPTLIGAKTATETIAPSLTITPGVPPTQVPPDTPTPIPELNGFSSIQLSASEFYLKGCEPKGVKFTVQAADAARTAYVVLFVRFKSTATGVTSEWNSITMENLGNGTFTHTLTPSEMKAVDIFENPWVQYQLVATNNSDQIIGRTQVFGGNLSLKECVSTPSPTSTP